MDLEAIAPILEDIIRQSLYEKRYPFGFANDRGVGNKVASGTLARSVEVNVGKRKSPYGNYEAYFFQVLMEEYGQWVQSGRSGGKGYVPVGSLMRWIKQRGLKGRDKKGRFMTDKSFAFAIQTNIKKFGIRPSNFLDVSLEKVLNDSRIVELMGDASYEDLINVIEGI
jgi:hypothetical protein